MCVTTSGCVALGQHQHVLAEGRKEALAQGTAVGCRLSIGGGTDCVPASLAEILHAPTGVADRGAGGNREPWKAQPPELLRQSGGFENVIPPQDPAAMATGDAGNGGDGNVRNGESERRDLNSHLPHLEIAARPGPEPRSGVS
jgi:hypothetical protein